MDIGSRAATRESSRGRGRFPTTCFFRTLPYLKCSTTFYAGCTKSCTLHGTIMFDVVQLVRKKRTRLVLKPVDCLLDAQHARTISQPSFLKDSSGRWTLHFYNQKTELKRQSTKISRTRGPRVEPVQCFIDTTSIEVEMKEMFRCREVPKIPIAPLLDIECTSIDDENTFRKDSTQNLRGDSGGIGRTVGYDKGTPLQPRKSVLKSLRRFRCDCSFVRASFSIFEKCLLLCYWFH